MYFVSLGPSHQRRYGCYAPISCGLHWHYHFTNITYNNCFTYIYRVKYLVWNVQESDGELDSAMSDSVMDETQSETEMDIDMTQPAVQRKKGRGRGKGRGGGKGRAQGKGKPIGEKGRAS